MLLALLLAALAAPDRVVTLEGDTHHVQGIAVRGTSLYLTAVDRANKKGFLFEYDRESGKRLRVIELQQGDRFHAGGISLDGDTIWIPIAEYRRDGSSIVEQRSLKTFEVLRRFEVEDHTGAVAAAPDHLYGANWDARTIYTWDREGKQLGSRPNPSPAAYQDMKWAGGALVASGLVSGNGVIDWLDPATLTPIRTLTTGKTDRGVVFTHEGMAIDGGMLYLLPEDSPSRLFVFRLPKGFRTAPGR
jgi:hypothetical protein